MYIPKKREKKKVAVFLEKNASKLKHFRRTIEMMRDFLA